MSWTLSVPVTPRADWDKAVDAAEPVGDNAKTETGQTQVALAKKTMKLMASVVNRPKLTGHAGGHAIQEGDGANFYDGVSANVSAIE